MFDDFLYIFDIFCDRFPYLMTLNQQIEPKLQSYFTLKSPKYITTSSYLPKNPDQHPKVLNKNQSLQSQ